MNTPTKRALLIIDLQPDFLPGGPLAVPEGDAVIPPILALARSPRYAHVVASQDWHPADHGSFAANHPGRSPGEFIELDGLEQVLWPVHCVAGSPGAALIPPLLACEPEAVFQKGRDPEVDSYSAFFDNARRSATGLESWLRERGVTAVEVCGLAQDYCVKFTALDALSLGFSTTVIADATRAVNLQPGDDARALAAIREAGGEVVDSAAVLREAQQP
ncbi:bifunctional nicotinamidase/pyrazinamidase [Pseudenhygromyxa sp. WMMC2535]|uniref:bifunctional nicotinamidase/pyrazinamidase n=1 Tax=Pseudenhygromyxa sp. WMMC2535 TaxID=2712867 RepID=UPI001557658F|nr:bifunctional nicotinamidase/pyrazinamidase [Pseudenhygromyxa sp. WMMC2535]NVB39152.1 bifunctional nicotinamidase/pyrazinamidase [Pseudenhygromyxa sp. WMMC2535]